MVCDSIDWSKEIVFGAISEWQLPFLIKMCSKKSSIRYCVDCPLFQKTDGVFKDEKSVADAATVKPLEKRFQLSR